MNDDSLTISITKYINGEMCTTTKHIIIKELEYPLDELKYVLHYNPLLNDVYKELLIKYNKTKKCNNSEYFINTKQYEYN